MCQVHTGAYYTSRYSRLEKPFKNRLSSMFFFSYLYFPASGQAVVTSVIRSSPRFLPSIFIAHRVQQSNCLSTCHRVLLTHALALLCTRQSPHEFLRVRMRSGELEFTKLTIKIYQAQGYPDTPPGLIIRSIGCCDLRLE